MWKACFKTLTQIMFFIFVSSLMDAIVHYFQFPVPGSILGIILLFVLLQTKVIRQEWVDFGANWLIAEMLLFFIPSAVGVVQYKSLMLENGLRILLVILGSSVMVMTFAGLLAQKLAKPNERNVG